MPSRHDISYTNEYYQPSSKSNHKKPRRPNRRFLTTLHVFIALVLLDCIAEQQKKRSQRLDEASSKSREHRTSNPKIGNRPAASPSLPELPLSQFQDSKELSTAEHKLLKRNLAAVAKASDPPPKGKSWTAGVVPDTWKLELTRLFAWMPLDTMEELLEVVMEVISEASDVI